MTLSERIGVRAPRVLLGLGLALFGMSCRDFFTRSAHPIVGKYDLAIAFTTYVYTTGTCPPNFYYCTDTLPAGDVRVTGTLDIPNSVVALDTTAVLRDVRAVLVVSACGNAIRACPGNGGPTRRLGGDFYSSKVSESGAVTLYLASENQALSLEGQFEGRTIVGTIHWYTFSARDWFTGTFTARRRSWPP